MSQDVLYTNYEYAQHRLDSNDLFVVRLLAAIHRSMLENANTKVRPEHPFDMRYYYDALIRSVADAYDYQVQDTNIADSSISVANVPDFSEADWAKLVFVQNGMASKFVTLVQNESQPNGAPFDLSFACHIAGTALDEETLQFARAAIGEKRERPENDFDDWLGGFTTNDES